MSDLSEDPDLASVEQEALELSWAAIRLDRARMARGSDPVGLVTALEENLQLWMAIKAAVNAAGDRLPEALAANLVRLADFVAATILNGGVSIAESAVDTIVNVNLQVSEGLLESRR